jgi:uncharacterized protein
MNNEVTEVSIRAILPLNDGCALFLGNAQKCFIIHIHPSAGEMLSLVMRKVKSARPMTHDLMSKMLQAFGGKVERVIINDVQETTFFARLIMVAENQLHQRKVVELDARPSDALTLAAHFSAPIYVARKVWESVQDRSSLMESIQEHGVEATKSKFTSPPGKLLNDLNKLLEEIGVTKEELLAGEDDEEDEDDEIDFLAEDDDDLLDDEEEDDDDDDDLDPDEEAEINDLLANLPEIDDSFQPQAPKAKDHDPMDDFDDLEDEVDDDPADQGKK